ncbi:MAG: hypothetical protein KKA19_02100, partial [Candidatus Margulisbacteria bacterium]|nr:hypothetical protein [Candidatus Margulisiibacteriota bacterium]
GVESLSDSIQSMIRKRIPLAKLENVIEIANKLHIQLTLAFMLGFPGETNADRKQLIEFVEKYRYKVTDWRFSPLTIYPGTTFWKEADDYQIELNNVNMVDPVGLPKSYVSTILWTDLLQDLIHLYRLSIESQLKNGSFYNIISPSVQLQQ